MILTVINGFYTVEPILSAVLGRTKFWSQKAADKRGPRVLRLKFSSPKYRG